MKKLNIKEIEKIEKEVNKIESFLIRNGYLEELKLSDKDILDNELKEFIESLYEERFGNLSNGRMKNYEY